MDRSTKPPSQTNLRTLVPVKPSTSASGPGVKTGTKLPTASGDAKQPNWAAKSAAVANGNAAVAGEKAIKRQLELQSGSAPSKAKKKRTSESGSVSSGTGEESSCPKKSQKQGSASGAGDTVTDGKVSGSNGF